MRAWGEGEEGFVAEREEADQAQGERYYAVGTKHTEAQMKRSPRRKLFDREAKEDFLGWYAASGNCAWAAEKAGFNDATVWRHRADDADFDEACERAYQQGIARAKVAMLEARMRRAPYAFDADREVPDFEVDPDIAMQLIREHERANGTGPGRRGKQGRRPRVASNAEVEEALVKRLAAFGKRVAARAASGGDAPAAAQSAPPPSDACGTGRSPSPSKLGED